MSPVARASQLIASDDLHQPLVDGEGRYGSSTIISVPPLYDCNATLRIRKEVAYGLLIFLSGGTHSPDSPTRNQRCRKRDKMNCSQRQSPTNCNSSSSGTRPDQITDDSTQLAFASLTDGNVIDKVFGVATAGGIWRAHSTTESEAYTAALEAKNCLRDASYSSDSIPRLAVEAYCNCFEAVANYHHRIEKLGFFFRIINCGHHDIIHSEAIEKMEVAFSMLREAIESAT